MVTYPAIQSSHTVGLRDVNEHLQHVFPGAIVRLRLEADLQAACERGLVIARRMAYLDCGVAKLARVASGSGIAVLTKVERMCHAGSERARRPSKPEGIAHRRLLDVLALSRLQGFGGGSRIGGGGGGRHAGW